MLSRDLSLANLLRLRGRPVYARGGEKIGRLHLIVYDEETGRPEWVAIRKGFLWPHTYYAPAGGLARREDGLRLPFSAKVVRSAPKIRKKSIEQSNAALARHYRLLVRGEVPPQPPVGSRQPAGAVTVRKWVEQHTRKLAASIRRETLLVRRVPVYEPIDGATLGSQEVVVTLYDAEPVPSKSVVAREHIVLAKQFEMGDGGAHFAPQEQWVPLTVDSHQHAGGASNGNRESA